MKRFLLAIVLTALAAGAAHTRVKTTQPYLSTNAITVPVITISTDTTAVPTGIPDNAISLRGFHKRASDSKESFFVTNHLSHRISCIRVLFRYSTLDGQMLTERVVSIPVDLRPDAVGDHQIIRPPARLLLPCRAEAAKNGNALPGGLPPRGI